MNSVYLDEDLGRRIFDILTDSVEYTSIEELKKAKKRGRPSKSETEDKQEEVEAAEVAPEYVTVENEVNFWGDVAVVGGSAVKNNEDRNLVLQCAMLISGYEGGFKDADIKGYLHSLFAFTLFFRLILQKNFKCFFVSSDCSSSSCSKIFFISNSISCCSMIEQMNERASYSHIVFTLIFL